MSRLEMIAHLLAQAAPAAPEGLYDIVVPSPERPLWPVFVFLAIALLLVGGIVWLVIYLLRNRDASSTAPPPAVRTLKELDRVERDHEDLTPNRFSLAVSEALKNYFAERFRDPVRYETTEEFLARLAREGTTLPPAAQQELRDFLTAAEAVKFGNSPDTAGLTRPLLKSARNLVSLCESVNAQPGSRK